MTDFMPFEPGQERKGDLIVKLYHSGDQIRGFIRKVVGPDDDDAVFPGEEMEPPVALEIARNHLGDGGRILIELTEGVAWDDGWTRHER